MHVKLVILLCSEAWTPKERMNLGFNVPASFSITSATRFLSATVSWFFRPVISAFDYPQAGPDTIYSNDKTYQMKWGRKKY